MLRPLSSLHLLSYCCSRCRGVWPVRIDGFCSAASFFVDYPRGYQCPWVQRPLPLNPRTLIITTVIIKEAGSRTEVVESQLSRLSMSVGSTPVVLCTIRYGTVRETFRVQKVRVRAQYPVPHLCREAFSLMTTTRRWECTILCCTPYSFRSFSDRWYGCEYVLLTCVRNYIRCLRVCCVNDISGSIGSFSWSSVRRLFVSWLLNGENPTASQLWRLLAVIGIGNGDLHVGGDGAALTCERHAAVPCAASYLHVRVSLVLLTQTRIMNTSSKGNQEDEVCQNKLFGLVHLAQDNTVDRILIVLRGNHDAGLTD